MINGVSWMIQNFTLENTHQTNSIIKFRWVGTVTQEPNLIPF
jgi:hypothetical protein